MSEKNIIKISSIISIELIIHDFSSLQSEFGAQAEGPFPGCLYAEVFYDYKNKIKAVGYGSPDYYCALTNNPLKSKKFVNHLQQLAPFMKEEHTLQWLLSPNYFDAESVCGNDKPYELEDIDVAFVWEGDALDLENSLEEEGALDELEYFYELLQSPDILAIGRKMRRTVDWAFNTLEELEELQNHIEIDQIYDSCFVIKRI